jgi:hypothetical protein
MATLLSFWEMARMGGLDVELVGGIIVVSGYTMLWLKALGARES